MKKRQMAMLLMLLCMVAVSSATSILWCSGKDTTDFGWTDLLVAEGYTVDRLAAATVMTQEKVDLANTYDLVIFGRDAISGDYVNTGEAALWNSITAPMICQSGYMWQNSRWKWLNSNATQNTGTGIAIDLATDHPLYAILLNGVTVNEDGTVPYVSSQVTLSRTSSAGNGVLIGHRFIDSEPWVYAAYWPQSEVEFYSGSGYYPKGPRMALAAGNTDDSNRGAYNLNDNGKIFFLNAVYYMSGATFNRKPSVSAGNRIVNVNEMVTLEATAFDPDSTLTISWTQISGPAAAVFEDASVLTPDVTFPVKGTYELEIEVADGATVVTDQVTVTVRDNADNMLLAHWDFESLPDPNTLTDITGNGFTGIYYNAEGKDPNVIAGNLFGGSQAADLASGLGYWEVPNSYGATDPNFNALAASMTAAVWVKNSDSSIGAPMIVGNGLDGWRLQANLGNYNFACQPIGIDFNSSGVNPYDGTWHHVVAVYDGIAAQAHLYVDGLLSATRTVTPGNLIIKGDAYPMIQIANRGDADRPWKGGIDDIRVYNYPLTAAEVAALALEGNLPVKVTAGDDQTIAYKGEPVQMAGALLSNDGFPEPALLYWSVVGAPTGVDFGSVLFSDGSTVDPVVTFPNVSGIYILRLTATDDEFTVFDDVNIDLLIPSCADVLADGLGIAADLSGPEGVSDCRVDIYDIAAMASDWLRCNDPADAGCEWAYQQ
jgi:hypothetical protein